LDIADNIITVNAFNPGVRFGGLAVIDSGSSPQVSGSILFDSIKDQWIFVHQNQSVVTSSVVLMGPETYNDLGNESYISANRLPKGSGVEHLRDSNITDTGTVVSVNSNTSVTGSFTVVTGSAVELQVTNTGVNIGNSTADIHNITGSLRVSGSLAVTGAGTFSSSVTSNNYVASAGNNTTVFNSANATTGWVQMAMNNTNGSALLGIEGSSAGTLATGTNAYASVLRNYTATDFQIATNNTVRLTLSSTGAATFSSTVRINADGQSLLIFPTTTNSVRMQIQSTGGGNLVLGTENSTGGDLASGTNAYASVLTSGSTRDLVLGTNSTSRLTINGTTGAATFLSNDGSGNRTTVNDVLTITQTNPNSPYSGFGSGLLFRGTTYNGGGSGSPGVRNWGRIVMQLTDSSISTTGENMVFQVASADNSDTLTTALTLAYNGAATFSSSVTATSLTAGTNSGSSVNITTNGNNGTSGSPLQTNVNFYGYNGNLNGQIRVDDVAGTAQVGTMKFYTWNSGQVLALTLSQSGTATFSNSISTSGALFAVGDLITTGGRLLASNGNQAANTESASVLLGNRGYFTTSDIGAARISAVSTGVNWYNGTALAFYTNPGPDVTSTGAIERMRITSDNNVLFNTTSSGTTNTSSFIFRSGTGAYSGVMVINHATTNNTGAGFIDCYYNTGYIGGIQQNGTSNVSFTTSSDYRLKQDLKDFNGLNLISNLKVYDFKWKTEDSRMHGVIAHELQEVIPYAVHGNKDEIKENGKIKVQVVDYSKLVPVLVKAIQELKSELDTAKAEIQLLKQQ